MGTSASKSDSSKQLDEWNAALLRSRSVPACSSLEGEERSSKASSWKSKLCSLHRPDTGGKRRSKGSSMLKPVKEEGLDRDAEHGDQDSFGNDSVGQAKKRAEARDRSQTAPFRSGAARNPRSSCHPSFQKETLEKHDSDLISQPRSLSSRDFGTSVLGLRVLLNPDLAPSESVASPKRGPNFNNLFKGSLNFRLDDAVPDKISNAATDPGLSDAGLHGNTANQPGSATEGADTEPPLFDPSLLATFERVVDALSSDGWQTSDFNTPDQKDLSIDSWQKSDFSTEDHNNLSFDSWQTSDFSTSENTSTSSETCSEGDSPPRSMKNLLEIAHPLPLKADDLLERSHHLPAQTDHLLERSNKLPAKTDHLQERSHQRGSRLSVGKTNIVENNRCKHRRKLSFSRLFSLCNDYRKWSREDFLEMFERRCPPGCENKIVLYFTSLRGVRETFKACCKVRLILKGYRVHVDERDVWMHSRFREELTNVMMEAVSVPRLFIMGRYIGGAEEVELLHEEGVLSRLIEGLPTRLRQACAICGDVRFIPCTTCNGSCKTMSPGRVVARCPDCNENGLIMCSVCMS